MMIGLVFSLASLAVCFQEWRLFTTGPGAITLALEVTGSTGTWTRHELALDVLDD